MAMQARTYYNFNQTGLNELKASLTAVGRDITRSVSKSLERNAGELSREIKNEAPRASGMLAESIEVLTLEDSARKVQYAVVATAPHAAAVEFGAQYESQPPKEDSADHSDVGFSIIDWVEWKSGGGSDYREDARLAYVIARKLKAFGFEAQPFFRPAFEANRGNMLTDAVIAASQAARRHAKTGKRR